ncbi:unnamed protein product [Victoria cruziana]
MTCYVDGSLCVSVYGEEPYCGKECDRRCIKTDRHNMCIRACNTCCKTCHCVPPGTSGNRDSCPCYAKMKTHKEKYKCP